jgi:hypothetical protein
MKFLHVTLLGLLGFASIASAETYNFYFDQTNQAAPTLSASTPVTTVEVKPTHLRMSFAGLYGSRAQNLGSGGGVSLGANYLITEKLQLNAALGLELGNKAFGLLEAEYAFIRLPFEAGLLLGANTFQKVDGNSGSIHAGAKVNIRLSRAFELTAALRANLGFAMGETGLAYRL